MQPSFGPIVFIPKQHDCYRKENSRQITRNGQGNPLVIINPRHHCHAEQTKQSGKSLLLQIIKRIMEFYPAVIGACAVEQHKTDPHENQDNNEKRIVKSPFLSGTLQYKSTP